MNDAGPTKVCPICGRAGCNSIEIQEVNSLRATLRARRSRAMPKENEFVGADMIEYELSDGTTVLVHPDDVEQFEKQQEAAAQQGNDAAIMAKLREQYAGDVTPKTQPAGAKRVSAESKAEAPAEDKAAEAPARARG